MGSKCLMGTEVFSGVIKMCWDCMVVTGIKHREM